MKGAWRRRAGAGGYCERGDDDGEQREVPVSAHGSPQGVVVDRVNVRVLLYFPALSASVTPTCCWNSSVTAASFTAPV